MPPDQASESNPLVLVVEDSSDNLRLIEAILKMNGFRTVSTSRGNEVEELARSQSPDVILMDLQLPVMDGLTATRQLKADEDLKRIPVIAITAFSTSESVGKAREAGCVDYIRKPFTASVLLAKVRSQLEQPPEAG